jgi:hypothetical protein
VIAILLQSTNISPDLPSSTPGLSSACESSSEHPSSPYSSPTTRSSPLLPTSSPHPPLPAPHSNYVTIPNPHSPPSSPINNLSLHVQHSFHSTSFTLLESASPPRISRGHSTPLERQLPSSKPLVGSARLVITASVPCVQEKSSSRPGQARAGETALSTENSSSP